MRKTPRTGHTGDQLTMLIQQGNAGEICANLPKGEATLVAEQYTSCAWFILLFSSKEVCSRRTVGDDNLN